MYGFLIIFYLGLGFSSYGAYVLRSHSKMKSWPTIEGKLIAIDFGLDSESTNSHRFYYRFPKPTYEYQVDGVKYVGYKVNQDIKSTWIAVNKPDQKIDFYCEVGGLLKVHYHPKNPAKSVLQIELTPKRKSHYLAICVAGILLIAISFALAFYLN